ncbi:uncharacterized protein LOC110062180 isoform X2 [Orbicella faveolata]|uniref:uncharacterized protein LOC110062180 isoform X2 n=1 Tax=Orbicella faveolata TaxID=48498 RepID=UPI0009E5808F|nr:uncharacterized protein LOC110062180 isoform X2 [Orbicella faveolata]
MALDEVAHPELLRDSNTFTSHSKIVKLNIGGHHFSTSLETLTKDPGSMLHAMFSGRFDTKPSEDGSYFIDRDGTHFRYILNYLRTGQLLVPKDEMVRRELLTEAEFYRVEGIINNLRAGSFKESLILSPNQCQILMSWLKGTSALKVANLFPCLLYRASWNGWAASSFHSCCDGKGPTVTVIKSGNYIFGGYTEQAWETSEGDYREAPGSFLFSLVNPSGLPPTKMPLIAGREGNAIYCDSSCGPAFGRSRDNPFPTFDLKISSLPHSSPCSVRLNGSYQCPTGQDATTFLTGSELFTVSEMEVFGFE